jgi:hypothetical protein
MVTAANATNMAAGTKHTRRTCLLGPDKDKWLAAEYAQLDKHNSYGMWGDIIARSDVPPDAKIIRPIWNYTQKGSGEHKARNCMDGKQLVRMGAKIGNTYAACMEQPCLRLLVALMVYLGNIIEDGDVVNTYAHAEAEGTPIYIVVDDVFKAWFQDRFYTAIYLGSCVQVCKAMQGHPSAGSWWSDFFDKTCAAPLLLRPAFTKPTIYRRDDSVTSGMTLMIRHVDDIMAYAAHETDRKAILEGIANRVMFKISPHRTTLFYATNIDQMTLYIKVHATSYITSFLTKIGWATSTRDSAILVPMPPSTVKYMAKSPGPLDPEALSAIVTQFGFQYRTLTGMLIFAVQIGRFDIAPAVSIRCKFNDRPGAAHFLAANNVMRYLHSEIERALICWRPTGKDRPDLPRAPLTPYRPEANIDALLPQDFPILESIFFVDASYGGLLTLGEPCFITGINIMLGGTAIFAKTRIQRTTALSSIESDTMTGCEAGKHIKYFCKLFVDLRFPLTGTTPMGEDNKGTIMIAHHHRPSGRTRHTDLQFFATQEWVQQGLMTCFKANGQANPADALSKVLYCILNRRHFERMMGYYGSPHILHTVFRANPNDNPPSG